MDENTQKFDRIIKSSITNCFEAVQLLMVFFTRRILPAILKDVLSTMQQSNVVVMVGLPDPFLRMGARMNSTESQ